MKRLAVLLAVVAGLVLAGAAGAIVQYKIITVKNGDYARAGTSSILCQGVGATSSAYFNCGSWSGSVHTARSYSASIGTGGVAVYRWDAKGKNFTLVKNYR